MKRKLLAVAMMFLCPAISFAADSSSPISKSIGAFPDGLGVNIHFTDPKPGEMGMLAAAGFKWVRMDFSWDGTEKQKGEYDFSAYDRLMSALDGHHIRPIFILDYSNPNYDDNLSPHTDAGREAFAKWAATAAIHFKGRGVIWEMYNEPNIAFWEPKPNTDDYTKLALSVGKVLCEATPEELYIGPACSTMDFKFLEACFKALLFRDSAGQRVAVWTTGEPHDVLIPGLKGTWRQDQGHDAELRCSEKGLTVHVSDAPQYLIQRSQ